MFKHIQGEMIIIILQSTIISGRELPEMANPAVIINIDISKLNKPEITKLVINNEMPQARINIPLNCCLRLLDTYFLNPARAK